MHLDQYAVNIYAQNKAVGWWDDPDRCIFQTLQLVSTEIAEATEGERKNLMDDHLPTRKMGEVELADALIRVLDLAGRFGWKYRNEVPHPFIDSRSSIGKQHLGLNMALVKLAETLVYATDDGGTPSDRVPLSESIINDAYSVLAASIMYCAALNGYRIYDAMDEKLVYNIGRADHKRERRAEEHGKKF